MSYILKIYGNEESLKYVFCLMEQNKELFKKKCNLNKNGARTD